MAKILVVDDRAVNRQFLVTLLGYDRHQLVEAEDGTEALEKTRAERPDLIITDILMPTMNGLEFVNRLRAEEPIAQTPVIFYSATYLQREAQVLARACGVTHVLAKPCDPETILTTVRTALGAAPPSSPSPVPKASEIGPTDQVAGEILKRGKDLETVTLRLAALIELSLEWFGDRNPQDLLRIFCRASRRIVSAQYGLVAILEEGSQCFRYFVTDGTASEKTPFPAPTVPLLDTLLNKLGVTHWRATPTDLVALGLPATGTDARAFLGGPLRLLDKTYGCLCFVGKLGAEDFDAGEERLVATLAAQISVAYENARLYEEINRYTRQLQQEVLERQRVAEALQVSEEKFRRLLEGAPDAIITTNSEGQIVFVNEQVEKLFGYTRDELLGQTVELLLPENLRQQHVADRASYTAAPHTRTRPMARNLNLYGRRKDGSSFPVEISLSHMSAAEGLEVISIITDITKRKQAEEDRRKAADELQQREQEYRSIVENVPDVVWRADAEGNITFVSSNVGRIFGYTAEEIYALGEKFWPGRIHPEDRERVFQAYQLLFSENHKFDEEYRIQRQDGHWIWAHDRAIRSYLKEGKRVADGIFTDLTEWRSLQEQFQQAQKMESVGRLAGGIAHDFNNLVTIITGYSQVVQDRLADDDPLRPKVDEIRKAGDRAAALTRQLLAFSRRQVLQPQVLDLNDLVTGMESMLRPLLGEHIELTFHRKEGVGQVKADHGQLEQVIMNLAVNARDAMPQGGKLMIELANADLNESYAQQHIAVSPGHYVMLAVSDTGCGMDAETKRQIFEPFFTTKEQGKGTGLGLSTVYGIVKQSGGNIWVYSEPGKGTAFKVYLPRVLEPTEVVQSVQAPAEMSRGSETILVVEDEPALREFIVEVLKERGYAVLEAEGPKYALSIGNTHPQPIHLLLTDMIMPEIGGRELAKQLTKLHPETVVLYMSGYTDDTITLQGLLEADSAFLQKPFAPKQLTAKVRDVLDQSGKTGKAQSYLGSFAPTQLLSSFL